MSFWQRQLHRALLVAIGAGVLWVIVTQVFVRLDAHLPVFIAVVLTYIISAYFLLPLIIRLGVALPGNKVPRMTRAGTGLVTDPVNLLLAGSTDELIWAFKEAGWYQADPLTPRTALKMIRRFIMNRPYHEAPFSAHFLFGRKQDIGFQQPIGNSPRKRHHVRFWAADVDPQFEIDNIQFWFQKREVDHSKPITWVGSATKDIGFGLTRLSYQVTHRIDKYVDEERDFIMHSLQEVEAVVEDLFLETCEPVVGKFVSDGKIRWARLASSG